MDQTCETLTVINDRLKLIERPTGLSFGTDAYLLAAFVPSRPREDAAELGGGSGVVSLLAAARGKFRSVTSVELQPVYADLIRRNAELNGLEEKICSLETDVRKLSVKDTGGEVKTVFSNPPYLRAGSGFPGESPERVTARREENGTIRDFCAAASRILAWGGTFTVVFRPERLAELFCSMRAENIEPKRIVFVHPAPSSPPSLVLAEGKKGAGEGMIYARPLIIYADGANRVYTPDMQAVYDDFTLEHLFRESGAARKG